MDLQLIHLTYLALHVNLLILLMSHLTPTINYSKIRMVKYLLDMLGLTAGTVPLWRKSGFLKVMLKIFRWMSSWHHHWRNLNPRSNSSGGPKSSRGSKSSTGQNYARTRDNAFNMQGNYKEYEYERYSSNHYVHKSSNQFSAYSYEYFNPPTVKRSALASMPPFSYGARRMMNALPPLQVWVVKKLN